MMPADRIAEIVEHLRLPQLAEVRLEEVLSDLRSEFVPVAQSRGLTLDVDSIDLVLRTDRVLFRQLLHCLLDNAVKYTDRGRVQLRCAATADALLITVVDTGVGIPEERVGRIFDDPADGGDRRVGRGLALVREITRLLGYRIKVTSTVDSGTQFELHLPGRSIVAANGNAEESAASADSEGGKLRLVLVEDNDEVRTAMELFLNLEGYETLTAGSAAAAKDLLGSLRAGDILIVDYHLDGSNTGLELTETLRRELNAELPVIILSGDLPAVQRMIQSPFRNGRLLDKPVDIRALIQTIEELSRVG